jgi:16S rRNA processing protein RimM
MKTEFLECGKICNTHGVRGGVRIEPWCDSPRVLASRKKVFLFEGGEYRSLTVKAASVRGSMVIMSFAEVETMEAAQGMKNKILYLHRDDIPVAKGAVLIADMIGLPVINIDTGRVYGRLSEVNEGVCNKLYTVKCPSGDVLLPGIPEFVKEIDTERGIFIRPIPGFFSEDEV